MCNCIDLCFYDRYAIIRVTLILADFKWMSERSEQFMLKRIINPITLTTGLIVFVGLILAGLAVLFLARSPAPTIGATPVVTMIAASTLTPRPTQPISTPTPTATSIFFLPEGVIGVGAYVQVSGTGGVGLRMRAQPGLDGIVAFSALDSEVFLVIDGPIEEDGYQWWLLEAPYDSSRTGWSAGDFLSPIEYEND
jgi:hypothetical protein